MAIKIFYSILFAFIASSLFLFFKKPYSLLQQDKKSYSSLVEFKNINAIKNAQVFELPSVFQCDLWTLKFPYAVKLLAKWCHPATFENLNLEEERTRMLIELYGPKGAELAK